MAVLGVAIVYWILMSNFLRNTLEFGQGILILATKGTINYAAKNTHGKTLYTLKTILGISTLSFPYSPVILTSFPRFDLVTLTFHENINPGRQITENLAFESLLRKVTYFFS